MRTLRLAHLLTGLALIGGCDRSADRQETQAPKPTASPLYDRALGTLEEGVLWKPDRAFVEDPAFVLAPLIVQGTAPADAGGGSSERFGAVETDAGGAVRVDTDRPTVYAGTSLVVLSGSEHEQSVYVWRYPKPVDSAGVTWRWIRITLDAGGFPVIWEVHGDMGPTRQIFVSQSLETAAAAAFGPPLPGRRFSVERGFDEQPNVVVARVLDDGAQPMGPFVYVSARDRSVPILLCRCMPAQVSDITDSPYYDLLPLESLSVRPDALTDTPRRTTATAPAATGERDPSWLERALRLPAEKVSGPHGN